MAFKQVVSRSAIFRPWAKKDNSDPTPSSSLIPQTTVDVPSAFRTTSFLSHVPLVGHSSFVDPMHPHPHPLPLPDLLLAPEPKLFDLPPEVMSSYPPVVPRDVFGEKEGRWKAKKQRPKKFQCETCRVSFSNNGQLIAHRRIHSGERPFACDYEGCKKTFTRNEELTRHKRIHTGVRPHSCVLCGKSFGRKDHLHKHIKTHQRTNVVRLQAFQGLPYFVSDCIPWF